MTRWRLREICYTPMSWRTYRYERDTGQQRNRSAERGFLSVAERGRHRRQGGESCSYGGARIAGSRGIRSPRGALCGRRGGRITGKTAVAGRIDQGDRVSGKGNRK